MNTAGIRKDKFNVRYEICKYRTQSKTFKEKQIFKKSKTGFKTNVIKVRSAYKTFMKVNVYLTGKSIL